MFACQSRLEHNPIDNWLRFKSSKATYWFHWNYFSSSQNMQASLVKPKIIHSWAKSKKEKGPHGKLKQLQALKKACKGVDDESIIH